MLEEVVQRRFNSEVDIDETVVVYLLGTIFNNASSANVTDPEFSEVRLTLILNRALSLSHRNQFTLTHSHILQSIVQIASGILKRTDPEDNTMVPLV